MAGITLSACHVRVARFHLLVVNGEARRLRFPHRHPAVTTVLIGARSAEEIVEDLALAAADIPDGLWEDLDHAG